MKTDWTQLDLASRLGSSKKHVNQLISGKSPIIEGTAIKLESVLGSSASFWSSRKAQYRAKLAQKESEANKII